MIKFVENLLTTQLPLRNSMSLQIQRAHRALAQKPAPEATSRFIVINFLQFAVKETVLKLAWMKKVHINNKQILCDHDYAYEMMQKHRAYGGIKRCSRRKTFTFKLHSRGSESTGALTIKNMVITQFNEWTEWT